MVVAITRVRRKARLTFWAEKKLANKQFLEKAPPEVVEQAKSKKVELTEKISKLEESLESLK